MRISYLCYWNPREGDGVSQKIASQLALWRSSGHDAELFLLSPAPPGASSLATPERTFLFEGMVERTSATRSLLAAIRRYGPDLVYLRYDFFLPPPLRLMRRFPTVVEINSDAQAEARARSTTAALYERAQRQLIMRRAAAAVCVTHELAGGLRGGQRPPEVEVISNGIELDGIDPLPAPTRSSPRLAYLGDRSYWQGVDKIFSLAEASPDWEFDLIGVEPHHSRTNVTCHGFLSADRYEPILAEADVALGTLALHRKRMNEACALKVRRYLAYGLPVVMGHEDTDFIGSDPWFLLRLPNAERNVVDNLDRIHSFVTEVKGRRVARPEISQQVSAAVKEEERLALFARLTRSG